jgi:hypothetical protein
VVRFHIGKSCTFRIPSTVSSEKRALSSRKAPSHQPTWPPILVGIRFCGSAGLSPLPIGDPTGRTRRGSTTTRVTDFRQSRTGVRWPLSARASAARVYAALSSRPFRLEHRRSPNIKVRQSTHEQPSRWISPNDASGWPMVGSSSWLMNSCPRTEPRASYLSSQGRYRTHRACLRLRYLRVEPAGSMLIYNGSVWHEHGPKPDRHSSTARFKAPSSEEPKRGFGLGDLDASRKCLLGSIRSPILARADVATLCATRVHPCSSSSSDHQTSRSSETATDGHPAQIAPAVG